MKLSLYVSKEAAQVDRSAVTPCISNGSVIPEPTQKQQLCSWLLPSPAHVKTPAHDCPWELGLHEARARGLAGTSEALSHKFAGCIRI